LTLVLTLIAAQQRISSAITAPRGVQPTSGMSALARWRWWVPSSVAVPRRSAGMLRVARAMPAAKPSSPTTAVLWADPVMGSWRRL